MFWRQALHSVASEEAGVDDYLVKPVEYAQLFAALSATTDTAPA